VLVLVLVLAVVAAVAAGGLHGWVVATGANRIRMWHVSLLSTSILTNSTGVWRLTRGLSSACVCATGVLATGCEVGRVSLCSLRAIISSVFFFLSRHTVTRGGNLFGKYFFARTIH